MITYEGPLDEYDPVDAHDDPVDGDERWERQLDELHARRKRLAEDEDEE